MGISCFIIIYIYTFCSVIGFIVYTLNIISSLVAQKLLILIGLLLVVEKLALYLECAIQKNCHLVVIFTLPEFQENSE